AADVEPDLAEEDERAGAGQAGDGGAAEVDHLVVVDVVGQRGAEDHAAAGQRLHADPVRAVPLHRILDAGGVGADAAGVEDVAPGAVVDRGTLVDAARQLAGG